MGWWGPQEGDPFWLPPIWGEKMMANWEAPDVTNDYVEVYEGEDGTFYWRRVDSQNGRIVAVSGEGYVNEGYAQVAAGAYCPGVPTRYAD